MNLRKIHLDPSQFEKFSHASNNYLVYPILIYINIKQENRILYPDNNYLHLSSFQVFDNLDQIYKNSII